MNILFTLSLSLISLDFSAKSKIVEFTASKDKVSVNESFWLKWDVENAKEVYISNLGFRNVKDSIELKISESTKYVLYVEEENNLKSRSLSVIVEGSKKVRPYPNIGDYNEVFKKQLRLKDEKVTNVIDVSGSILDDDGYFWNDFFDASNQRSYIQSGFRLRKDLKKESHIRAHRVSYLIEIARGLNDLSLIVISISCIIEYAPMAEKEFYPEEREEVFLEAIRPLLTRIKTNL